MKKKTKPFSWPLDQSAVESARALLPTMAEKLFTAGRRTTAGRIKVRKLHEFRLTAKRFRYTLELFRPMYGPALDDRLSNLRRMQQLLGRISDCDVTAGLIRETGRKRKDRRTVKRVLAHLESEEKERIDRFLVYWQQSFDTPGEQERWVRYLRDYAGRAVRPPTSEPEELDASSIPAS